MRQRLGIGSGGGWADTSCGKALASILGSRGVARGGLVSGCGRRRHLGGFHVYRALDIDGGA